MNEDHLYEAIKTLEETAAALAVAKREAADAVRNVNDAEQKHMFARNNLVTLIGSRENT